MELDTSNEQLKYQMSAMSHCNTLGNKTKRESSNALDLFHLWNNSSAFSAVGLHLVLNFVLYSSRILQILN